MGKYDEYKREVLEVSQRLSEHGYFGTRSGSAGNVSVLIEGEEIVAVTPHGLPYAEHDDRRHLHHGSRPRPHRRHPRPFGRSAVARRRLQEPKRRQRRHSLPSDLREHLLDTERADPSPLRRGHRRHRFHGRGRSLRRIRQSAAPRERGRQARQSLPLLSAPEPRRARAWAETSRRRSTTWSCWRRRPPSTIAPSPPEGPSRRCRTRYPTSCSNSSRGSRTRRSRGRTAVSSPSDPTPGPARGSPCRLAKYVLAIDLGTSGCKAALVSVHGRVVAWCFHAVETRILPGGGAEQDPDDWWNALLDIVQGADRPRCRAARGDRGALLQHPGRGHRGGRCARAASHERHPLDGRARGRAPARDHCADPSRCADTTPTSCSGGSG